MVKATIVITDKSFRIVIPKQVRNVENLRVGDVIELDIVKKLKHRSASPH